MCCAVRKCSCFLGLGFQPRLNETGHPVVKGL